MKVVSLCFAAIVLTVGLQGGVLPSTDVVVNDLLVKTVRQLVQNIGSSDTVLLRVSQHPDAEYVESMIIQSLADNDVVLRTTAAPVVFDVVILDMATRYSATTDDSVMREVVVAFGATVSRNGIKTPVSLTPQRREDVCLRNEAKAAESMQHASTHGELPTEERTFWDDVLEPAIFIAAAATTVVLLFTVRSK